MICRVNPQTGFLIETHLGRHDSILDVQMDLFLARASHKNLIIGFQCVLTSNRGRAESLMPLKTRRYFNIGRFDKITTIRLVLFHLVRLAFTIMLALRNRELGLRLVTVLQLDPEIQSSSCSGRRLPTPRRNHLRGIRNVL